MTATMHRPAELPDGRTIPALHVRSYGGTSTTCGIGYFDDDKGWVSVAEDVPVEYGPMLAQSSTLYHELDLAARRTHDGSGHQSGPYRECPMDSCQRASRALLGADRNGPLI